MEKETVQIGLRCDSTLVEELTALAKHQDLTLSQVIRKALRCFLRAEETKENTNGL